MQGVTKRIAMSMLLAFIVAATMGVSAWGLVKAPAKSVEQWGVEEIALRSGHAYSNSFTEVQLQARFTSGGKSVVVAGFYDGGQTWRIRFMPEQQGAWQFTTISNDPELNNQSGKFVVVPPSSGNHGPVRVAKVFHFSYADGTPYFLLGTTLYNWLNRDEALQKETLESLSKSPFTKVRFGLFPKWYQFNRVEPALYPYVDTSPLKFDLDRFNPEFFRHVEQRLADLQRLGIQADIILFHPYDHLGFATMDAAHDDAYIQYVTARLSAYRNVWWTMANEYDLFDPSMTPGQKVKDWDRMFQVLEKSDPYSHPRGIHNAITWYDHSKPWITHVIIQDQTGHPGRRMEGARSQYKKPMLVDEYGYEGDNGQGWGNLSGAEELSRQWDIVMAGGYGSHGETYVHPGGVLWWAAGGTLVGDSPARMGFLKKVMTDGPFQDVIPSPDIVQGATALAVKGQYYLIRVKEVAYNRPVELQLEDNHSYRVDLIDPWQMKVYSLGETGGGLQAFEPPVTPSLLRFTRIDSPGQTSPVQTLIAKFLKDPTIETPPRTSPITQTPKMFTAEFTLGELMDDPRTAPLVKKYLPNLPAYGFIKVFTLEQIQQFGASSDAVGDVPGFIKELHKMPVSPQ